MTITIHANCKIKRATTHFKEKNSETFLGSNFNHAVEFLLQTRKCKKIVKTQFGKLVDGRSTNKIIREYCFLIKMRYKKTH